MKCGWRLVRRREATSATTLVKPHFYSFGGSVETARWLQRVREGLCELSDEGTRFTVSGEAPRAPPCRRPYYCRVYDPLSIDFVSVFETGIRTPSSRTK